MTTVGIDEVGRGCWAGPVVAGAVILKSPIDGLRDSKKLSKKQRQKLSVKIYEQSLAYGLGWVEASMVDEIGINPAVQLAMKRALDEISVDYDEIIIDGHINQFPDNIKARAVIKADDLIPAVSAASIIAKEARDQYMADISSEYPEYGFDQHVGYGTALHMEKLKLHGVTEFHRRSYKPVKALL